MMIIYNISKHLLLLFLVFSSISVFSQNPFDRIEPPNWWVGMEHNEIQLLLYGDDISSYDLRIVDSQVEKTAQTIVENPNYLFIDLRIPDDLSAENVRMDFYKENKKVFSYDYPLLKREEALFEGIDPSDVMYLITPDRFANGDPANDEFDDMEDKLDRKYKMGRHGGDIQGIIDQLDYIKDLGMTAIWLNPVIENDMPKWSYHGYAATDFYKVDRRYGSNENYKRFIELAAEKDIKVIMDMIMNHSGSKHWFVLDPPMENWINNKGEFVGTSHNRTTVQDI